MAELTPEAKKLIDDAVRIVREDQFEKFVRTRLNKDNPPPTPPDPKNPPDPNVPPAPPPKPGDPPPPANPPDDGKSYSRYWGEIIP